MIVSRSEALSRVEQSSDTPPPHTPAPQPAHAWRRIASGVKVLDNRLAHPVEHTSDCTGAATPTGDFCCAAALHRWHVEENCRREAGLAPSAVIAVRPTARPRELRPQPPTEAGHTRDVFLAALRAGLSRADASYAASVPWPVTRKLLAKGRAQLERARSSKSAVLYCDVREIEATIKAQLVPLALGGSTFAAQLLERRYPREYGSTAATVAPVIG